MGNTDQPNWAFYPETLAHWIPDRSASILVVAGGPDDAATFRRLGYTRVTISNVTADTREETYAPYAWSFQDAEHLTFDDGSFDYVVEHNGLHHLHSPHRGLLEMYRVARLGVVFIESRDSLAMSLATRLGISQVYEHSAVYWSGGHSGGVNNSEIPNFIYRWTERDVEKTIATFDPTVRPKIQFRYGVSMPYALTLQSDNRGRTLLVGAARVAFRGLTRLLRRQGNRFGAYIEKPRSASLHPWLVPTESGPAFNHSWAELVYRPRDPSPDDGGDRRADM